MDVVRFAEAEWEIHQKVAQLRLLSKSLSGKEVARLLVVGVITTNIVIAMREIGLLLTL